MRIGILIFVAVSTFLEFIFVTGWITASHARQSASGGTSSVAFSAPAADIDRSTEGSNEVDENHSAYSVLLDNVASCLTASDLKRDRGTDGAATGTYALEWGFPFFLRSCEMWQSHITIEALSPDLQGGQRGLMSGPPTGYKAVSIESEYLKTMMLHYFGPDGSRQHPNLSLLTCPKKYAQF
eukprot:scaffold6860_cov162-Amphora_coffeaeformis.AAC.4